MRGKQFKTLNMWKCYLALPSVKKFEDDAPLSLVLLNIARVIPVPESFCMWLVFIAVVYFCFLCFAVLGFKPRSSA